MAAAFQHVDLLADLQTSNFCEPTQSVPNSRMRMQLLTYFLELQCLPRWCSLRIVAECITRLLSNECTVVERHRFKMTTLRMANYLV